MAMPGCLRLPASLATVTPAATTPKAALNSIPRGLSSRLPTSGFEMRIAISFLNGFSIIGETDFSRASGLCIGGLAGTSGVLKFRCMASSD